jgi:hypothetical protein
MAKNWNSVADEYNGRFCSDIQIVDPFTGDHVRLGARAKSAKKVEKIAPKPYHTQKDYMYVENYKGKDLEKDFLLHAEGDYSEKEIKQIIGRWTHKKS